MTAASERVRECWNRACALAEFKGAGSADPRSIGAQIDAAAEGSLPGPERFAVWALLTEAWRLCSQEGRAEDAAECMRLAVAMTWHRGRVRESLGAARVIEDALWTDPNDGQNQASKDRIVVERLEVGLAECGFGPQEEAVKS